MPLALELSGTALRDGDFASWVLPEEACGTPLASARQLSSGGTLVLNFSPPHTTELVLCYAFAAGARTERFEEIRLLPLWLAQSDLVFVARSSRELRLRVASEAAASEAAASQASEASHGVLQVFFEFELKIGSISSSSCSECFSSFWDVQGSGFGEADAAKWVAEGDDCASAAAAGSAQASVDAQLRLRFTFSEPATNLRLCYAFAQGADHAASEALRLEHGVQARVAQLDVSSVAFETVLAQPSRIGFGGFGVRDGDRAKWVRRQYSCDTAFEEFGGEQAFLFGF